MSRKTPAVIFGVIVIIAVVVVLLVQNAQTTDTSIPVSSNTPSTVTTGTTSSGSTTSATGSTTSAPKTYTMADVAAHASASGCWTTINGNVYDVTAWISQHPGGAQAILSLCGKDGSSSFNDQHGGQRRPESELASFKIGALTK